MNKLNILTLTWEGNDKLNELYNSIIPSFKENWNWFIRDNGSKDNTDEIVNSWNDKHINYYKYSNNLSTYSQGNNWLFEKTNSNDEDYVLLLNNDIIFQDNKSINNMIEILDNDNDVGIVGAKLNYLDRPSIIQHCGVLFYPGRYGTPYHYRANSVQESRDTKNRYYPAVTGAVMMIRSSLFKEVNGLNEKYVWCWEDIDLCMKINKLGKKIVYCGETNILHSESASLKKNPVNKMYFGQNLSTFFIQWKNQIDKSLVEKYKDPNYALYK